MTSPRLKDIGENTLIKSLLPWLTTNKDLKVGAGDDCAVVTYNDQYDLLLKTDCVVESLHFTPTTPPHLIGRKALARVISDIAAMGGTPQHALITLFAHGEEKLKRIEGIYQGIHDLASQHHISIAGGETSGLPQPGVIINVMMTGLVSHGQAILRSTAKNGDFIAVTGKLGGSFESHRHLTFTPRLIEGQALCQAGIPSSMMDLSDGLGTDLPRLAEASGLFANIDEEQLPLHEGCTHQQGMNDGEDYELLFTFSPDKYEYLRQTQAQHFPDTPISIIGTMTDQGDQTLISTGWQHFQK